MSIFDQEGFLKSARHEGHCARYLGVPVSECPYGGGQPEASWLLGWDEARRIVFVSKAFLDDRAERGLECGWTLRAMARREEVEISPSDLQDMIEDAAYQGWHTDADASIVRPARSAFRALISQGVEYSQGVKRNRWDQIVPGDAN